MSETLFISTGESIGQVLSRGGSAGVEGWVMDLRRARTCDYVVLVQNREAHGEGERSSHHSAFLVGRIAGFEPFGDEAGAPDSSERRAKPRRWFVRLSSFAPTEISGAWRGARNPIRYGDLGELGIDVRQLDFQPLPGSRRLEQDTAPRTDPESLESGDIAQRLAEQIRRDVSRSLRIDLKSVKVKINIEIVL